MTDSEFTEKKLRQLEAENLRLRLELEARKSLNPIGGKAGRYFTKASTNYIVGKGLKVSVKQLLDELPAGKVSKDTIADVITHIIWRVTKIGTIALLAAAAPIIFMAVQTWQLNRQNDKLEIQNQLIGRQNQRLDQQINLEEGNRRSSLVFFMSNIMDRIDEEMRTKKDRKLSDPLIGRIVSLSQALRPYRYLENDQLTERQLSPERGQLLFSLVNSNFDKETYDRIFAMANFNYADLREANFTGAYLKGAKLANSFFYKANFNRANLEGADLNGSYLEEATFRSTSLNGVNLANANLRHSKMEDISMVGGNLENADLRWIFLDGDFRRTNLEGVKIQEATLTNVNLEGAYFKSTAWLDSLQYYDLKGLASLRDYYEARQEVKNLGNVLDTILRLDIDPKSPVMKIAVCSNAVEEILRSSKELKARQAAAEKKGSFFNLYPVSNPFGLEDLGIKKDSVYVYRVSLGREDVESTLMWLQFEPKSGELYEVFVDGGEPQRLTYNKSLLSKITAGCQTAN